MKSFKSVLLPVSVMLTFFAMAIASMPPPRKTYTPKPEPCTKHQPLNYSPILVKVNLSGTYTMKDLQEAQRERPVYIVNALNVLTPFKYQLANGVTPNLNLYVTINVDAYQHYGASVTGYVFDGNFNFTLGADYSTFEKLYDDIASNVNIYITRGWCKNCPTPCIIN